MKIRLLSLHLRNFKGIERLELDLHGADTSVYGANETGKSTVYAAFIWLLTGKDQFDRENFEIKNAYRKELNNLPHEVEGVFLVGDQETKLKRVYLEKWTKPRGRAAKEFDGHEVEYYHNDIPCKAGEYQEKVDAIIPSKILRLITNPSYFTSLKWQDQRRGLISIAGDISTDDIIRSIVTPDNDFADLIAALNDPKYSTLEDYRKHLQAKKKPLKEEAAKFQPRIQEVEHNMPERKDWSDIEDKISVQKVAIAVIDSEIEDTLSVLKKKQEGITTLQKEAFAAEQKIDGIRNKIRAELLAKQGSHDTEIATLRNRIKSGEDNVKRLEDEIISKQRNIKGYRLEIERLGHLIAAQRKRWDDLNAEKFEFNENDCNCPTCGQRLPDAESIEERRNKRLENFNFFISTEKKEAVKKSDNYKAETSAQEGFIQSAEQKIIDLQSELEEATGTLQQDRDALSSLLEQAKQKAIPDIDAAVEALMQNNGDALNLQDEISAMQANISTTTAAMGDTDNTELKQRRQVLVDQLDVLNAELSDRSTIEKLEARKQELMEKEEINAQEIARLERLELDVDTFTRAKMDILEEKVNGMFAHVKFRLFATQVNQEVVETCVCEYKGVPFPALNTAAQMFAGLDIVNTFSAFHGIHAPIFCDNRESVTSIPDVDSQVISLYVSPEDRKLRVNVSKEFLTA